MKIPFNKAKEVLRTIKHPEERTENWIKLLTPLFELEGEILSQCSLDEPDTDLSIKEMKALIEELEVRKKEVKDKILPYLKIFWELETRLQVSERTYQMYIHILKENSK